MQVEHAHTICEASIVLEAVMTAALKGIRWGNCCDRLQGMLHYEIGNYSQSSTKAHVEVVEHLIVCLCTLANSHEWQPQLGCEFMVMISSWGLTRHGR